jgi:hypothetical protein
MGVAVFVRKVGLASQPAVMFEHRSGAALMAVAPKRRRSPSDDRQGDFANEY